MSSKLVDERVVQMSFDNKNFEKNVKQSMGTVEELKASLDFSAVEVAAVTAISNITNKITDFSLKLVKSLSVDNLFAGFKQYEQETIAVGTLTNQLINDANFKAEILKDNINATLEDIEEKAKSVSASLTNELSIFSDETSMSFTAMLQGINAATASGIVKIEDAKDAMFFISEWFTSVGKSETDAANAYNMFARALNSGFFTYGQWQNLVTQRGITSSIINEELINSAIELGKLTKLVDGTYQTIDGKYYKLEELFQETALNTSKWLNSEVFTITANRMSGGISELIELVEETDGSISDLVQDTDIMNEVFGNNDIAKNLIKTTVEARTLTQAMDSVKISVTSAWKNIFKSIFGTYEEATELWTQFSLVMWSRFVDPLKNVENILADWKNRGGWDVLFSLDEEKAGVLWKILNNLFNIIDAVFGGVKELFRTTGEGLYNATVNFSNFIDKITPSEEFLSSISKISTSIFKTIRNIVSAIKPIITPVTKLFGVVADGIGIITTNISKMFESNKFFERMAGYLTVITEKISELFNNIASNENVTKFFEKLGDILSGILEIFMSLADIAGEFFTNFKNIGGNTIDGYVEGVKQGSTKVVKTVKSIASSVVDTFKKVLDINSPSKVTERIGENTGQGFIKGLEKEQDKIIEVSSNVITAFIKDVKEKIKVFNETDGNIFDRFSAAFKSSWTNVSGWWENDKFLHTIGEFFKKLGLWFAAAYEKIKLFAQENKIFERMGSMLESVGNILVYLFTKVLDLIARISDKIKEFNDNVIATDASNSIFNSLYELALSLGRVFLFIINIIQSFIDKIVEVLNETTDGDIKDSPFYGLMQSLGELFKAVLNLLGRIAPLLTAVVDKITSSINGLAQTTEDGEKDSAMPVLKAFFESLANLFKIMTEMLTSIFNSITTMMSAAKDSEKIKGLTKTITIILAVLLGLKLLVGIFWNMSITKKVLNPLKSFTVLLDSLAGYLDAARLAFFGKMLLNIGEGIALIIAAVISISNLKWEQLGPGLAIIGGVFAIIIAMLIIVNVSNRKILKLTQNKDGVIDKEALKGYKSIASNFIQIGFGLLLMAEAISILANVCIKISKAVKENEFGNIEKAFIVIIEIITILSIGMAIITSAGKSSAALGFNILAIAASLWLVISSLTKINRTLADGKDTIYDAINIIKPFFSSLLIFVGVLALMNEISSKFLDKADPSIKLFATIGGLVLSISLAIYIIVMAIKSLSYIKEGELEKVKNIIWNIAGFMGAIVILVTAMETIASIRGSGIKSSSAVPKQLMAIALSISLIVGAIWLIINVLKNVSSDEWETSVKRLTILGIIISLLTVFLEIVDGSISKLGLVAKTSKWSAKPIIYTIVLITAFAALLWFLKDQDILSENPGWLMGMVAVVAASISGILLAIGYINTLGKADVMNAKGVKYSKTLLSTMAALAILAALIAALAGLASILSNFDAWDKLVYGLILLGIVMTSLIPVTKLMKTLGEALISMNSVSIGSMIKTIVMISILGSGILLLINNLVNVINKIPDTTNIASSILNIITIMSTLSLLTIVIGKIMTAMSEGMIDPSNSINMISLLAFYGQIYLMIKMLGVCAGELTKNEKVFNNATLIQNFALFALTLGGIIVSFSIASVTLAKYSKYVYIAIGIIASFAATILLLASAINALTEQNNSFNGLSEDMYDSSDNFSEAASNLETELEKNKLKDKIEKFFEKTKTVIEVGGQELCSTIRALGKVLGEAIAEVFVDLPTNIVLSLLNHSWDNSKSLLANIWGRIQELFSNKEALEKAKKALQDSVQEVVSDIDTPEIEAKIVIDDAQLSALNNLQHKYQFSDVSVNGLHNIQDELKTGTSVYSDNSVVNNYITVNESNTPEETADAIAKELLNKTKRNQSLYN